MLWARIQTVFGLCHTLPQWCSADITSQGVGATAAWCSTAATLTSWPNDQQPPVESFILRVSTQWQTASRMETFPATNSPDMRTSMRFTAFGQQHLVDKHICCSLKDLNPQGGSSLTSSPVMTNQPQRPAETICVLRNDLLSFWRIQSNAFFAVF